MTFIETAEDTSGALSRNGVSKRHDNVIPLHRQGLEENTLHLDDEVNYNTSSSRSHIPQRMRKDFRGKPLFDEGLTKVDRELMVYTYSLIMDALDPEFDVIEKSNVFDEWKDSLQTIIEEVKNVSVNHRKILGALIVATRHKDLADFSYENLKVFMDATYMLRQLRINNTDSKRVVRNLIGIGADMVIPIAPDYISIKDENELDQLMKHLIEKSM